MYNKFKSFRPKYRTYYIVKEIRHVLEQYTDIEIALEKFQVEKDILMDILKNPRFFNLKMYEVAAKLLNKDIDELISIEEDVIVPDFRKSKGCNESEVERDIKLANLLFDEIINNKEINV